MYNWVLAWDPPPAAAFPLISAFVGLSATVIPNLACLAFIFLATRVFTVYWPIYPKTFGFAGSGPVHCCLFWECAGLRVAWNIHSNRPDMEACIPQTLICVALQETWKLQTLVQCEELLKGLL